MKYSFWRRFLCWAWYGNHDLEENETSGRSKNGEEWTHTYQACSRCGWQPKE